MPFFVNMEEIDNRISSFIDEKIRVERTILREAIESNKAELERLREDVFYEIKMMKQGAEDFHNKMEELQDFISRQNPSESETISLLEQKLQGCSQRMEVMEGRFSEFMETSQSMDELYQALTDNMLDNNAKLSNQLQINMRNEIDKNNTVLRKWFDEQQAKQEPILNVTVLKHEVQSAVEKNVKAQIAESAKLEKVKELEDEIKELRLQNEKQRQSVEKQAVNMEQLQAALAQLQNQLHTDFPHGQQGTLHTALGKASDRQTLTGMQAMQLHHAAKSDQLESGQPQAGTANRQAVSGQVQAGAANRQAVSEVQVSAANRQAVSGQVQAGAANRQAVSGQVQAGAANRQTGSGQVQGALSAQAGAGEHVPEPVETDVPAQQQVETVFVMDTDQNIAALKQIISQCEALKESLEKQLGRNHTTEVYFKMVAKCQEKFTELLRLTQEKELTSAKLASRTAKILKYTVIRALPQKSVGSFIEIFLQNCGVRKIEWEQGHKISGQDAYYMDETMVSYQETNDMRLDQCILHIDQAAYAVDFADESEVYEAIIPGIYQVGKYVK